MKTGVLNLGQVCLSLFFCLTLASCQQDEFYEKEFLQNPYQDPTVDGPSKGNGQGGQGSGEGGAQGGVNGGVNGGTNGGSTSGSTSGNNGNHYGHDNGGSNGGSNAGSTGGSDSGNDTGSTAGGVDGSTTAGGTDGSTTGGTDGSTTGGTDGSTTGGSTTGGSDGSTTGGSTTGGTTGGYGDCNNGHGNDWDRIDESNPTIGLESKCKKEVFRQAAEQTKKLDIIWVIDNSGSMADEQGALGLNFNAFIEDFITKNVDFKMAITTTDTRSSFKGLMVPGSAEKLTSAHAQANPAQFLTDFKNLVRVGTSGSGDEKGLEATEGFMQRYASTFLRPDAYLAVVILSDEEDQSPKSVDFYVDNLKSYKNEAGLVKVYSIVDINRTNSGYGITTGGDRYAEASLKTAGSVTDIRDDFHRSLSSMGDSIINLLDSFALESTPVDGTLKVYINRVETTDYTYDAASRSIKFDANRLPPVGAEITVTYVKQ